MDKSIQNLDWFNKMVPDFDDNYQYSVNFKLKGGRITWMTGYLWATESGVNIIGGNEIHIYKNRIIKIEKVDT